MKVMARGQVGRAGGPLLRDRNKALYANPEKWDGEAAGSVRDERMYSCTDHQGSVAALVEQARYSANGVPFGLPLGDVDADGDCDGADDTLHKAIETTGVYDVRGDLDLDGDVDSADWAIVTAGAGEVLGWGRLTSVSTASRHGYAALEASGAADAWMGVGRVHWHVIGLVSMGCEGALAEFGQPLPLMPPLVPVDGTGTSRCQVLCAQYTGNVAISYCFKGVPTICHCHRHPNHPRNPSFVVSPPSNSGPFEQCLHEYEVRNFTLGAVVCRPGETGEGAAVDSQAALCMKAANIAMIAACLEGVEQSQCKYGTDLEMRMCRAMACIQSKTRACIATAYAIACGRGLRDDDPVVDAMLAQCDSDISSVFAPACQARHRRR